MVGHLLQQLQGILAASGGEELCVDSFRIDAGSRDWVGDDDLFDLGDVFGVGGGDLLVGLGVGDEVGEEDGGAFEGADDSCERVSA